MNDLYNHDNGTHPVVYHAPKKHKCVINRKSNNSIFMLTLLCAALIKADNFVMKIPSTISSPQSGNL